MVREVSFASDGVRCAADMYWPDGVDAKLPCVVMGNGGSGTKRLGLPGYAQAFASRGMAVLAFDYRYFGASDGEPRQVIDVAAQQDDYRAAVHCVRDYDGVDPERVALWGTSLSGGHVLEMLTQITPYRLQPFWVRGVTGVVQIYPTQMD